MSKTLNKLAKIKWISRWAGSYTFISCSYWGPQYYHSLKKYLGVDFGRTLFIHKKGTVSFFLAEEEFNKLGKYLAAKSKRNQDFAREQLRKLKMNTDIILPLMNKLGRKIPTLAEYEKFLLIFDRHLAYHVFMKKTIDFLELDILEELQEDFIEARKYSESVYSESEHFFRSVMKNIAQKENRVKDFLTCLTQAEFEGYLKSGELPTDLDLKQRYEHSVLYSEEGGLQIITGSESRSIEDKVFSATKNTKDDELSGNTAYPGKITGTARIILDPHKYKKFEPGDVLITGMTRPEFMPLIKKASAIVTDIGGALCHAAITAREMKIPTIVGTRSATKVIEDGKRIRVDASNGFIKVL